MPSTKAQTCSSYISRDQSIRRAQDAFYKGADLQFIHKSRPINQKSTRCLLQRRRLAVITQVMTKHSEEHKMSSVIRAFSASTETRSQLSKKRKCTTLSRQKLAMTIAITLHRCRPAILQLQRSLPLNAQAQYQQHQPKNGLIILNKNIGDNSSTTDKQIVEI